MKIIIDKHELEVEEGTTVLEAARMIGGPCVPPTMCYYSKLQGCGGKCRCCLVEVIKGSDRDPRPMPKLQPACVTMAQDGMEVLSAMSPRALAARTAVTEFLLINHPLDCPVCDQAGECNLQDLAKENKNYKSRFRELKLTFSYEDIGPYIQLNKNRCIVCYRCVRLADQMTNNRVHGVMNRGDRAEISTYISASVENDFSGNMIDVCPVGALTDKTFRFESRVWFNKPFNARRNCTKCSGNVVLWMFGDKVQRVSARKDVHNEVEEFICNECRFDHKNIDDWTIDGSRMFSKDSVVNVNNYTTHLKKVKINTDDLILEGRKQSQQKISMSSIPYDERELEAIKKTKQE